MRRSGVRLPSAPPFFPLPIFLFKKLPLSYRFPRVELSNNSDRLARRILWSMAFGLILGISGRLLTNFLPGTAPHARWFAENVLDPAGQIFLRLLFFVVIPLVFSSLALGIVQLGRLDALGPLAVRTFSLFGLNMAIGVALGLLLMNLLQPGSNISAETKAAMLAQFSGAAQEIQTRAAAQPSLDLMFLVNMFMPRNLLKSIVEFEVLPLILFAILVGAAGTTLPEEPRRKLHEGLSILAQLMTQLVHFALLLAPFAVPAMIASVILKFGFSFLQSLSLFVIGVLFVMALHLFGTMSLLLKMFTTIPPLQFFGAIRTVLVTAFSTSSSNATLPTTIDISRRKLGISHSTAGFVLPLGATMNMSGTALYEGCVVLFIAQVYGVPLSIIDQMMLLLLAVLSAVAVAGIPGASLPLIVGLLITFHIPAEGIVLILGVDRILDMARTVLNVAADIVTACIVDQKLPIASPPAPK
jgi:Na+/H+-dicarboxylate symporter